MDVEKAIDSEISGGAGVNVWSRLQDEALSRRPRRSSEAAPQRDQATVLDYNSESARVSGSVEASAAGSARASSLYSGRPRSHDSRQQTHAASPSPYVSHENVSTANANVEAGSQPDKEEPFDLSEAVMPTLDYTFAEEWLRTDVFYTVGRDKDEDKNAPKGESKVRPNSGPKGRPKKGHKVINFATLQRIRLHRLQARVVKDVLKQRWLGKSYSDWKTVQDWEDSLEKYIKAWQDYDYIYSCVNRRPDPFKFTTAREYDNWILRAFQGGVETFIPAHERSEQFKEDIRFDSPIEPSQALGGSRKRRTKADEQKLFLQRLAMAAIGGLFLIGPMLLMVLHNSQLTALVTTSVCVVIFGFVMAIVLDAPFSVLSATAAYAAVLVVFVGTNNSSS